VHKRFGERVGFIPPTGIPDLQRLMHVGQTRAIDRGAEDNETCLGKM
jgi:hypothetical protein